MTAKATDSEVNIMKNWLRGAIDRNGGRAKRAAKVSEKKKMRTGLCRDVTSKCDFSSPSVPAAAILPGSSLQSSVDSETL